MQSKHLLRAKALTPYLEDFAAELAAVGHTHLTIRDYLFPASHFSEWLKKNDIVIEKIDEDVLNAFRVHRCRCHGRRTGDHVSRRHQARVVRFVKHLHQRGVIQRKVEEPANAAFSLADFRKWLEQHRGLTPVTIARHIRLLNGLLPLLGNDPSKYDAASVRAAALEKIRDCRPANAKTILQALRIYLRFLAAEGACRPDLDLALPPVAEWKLSSLPRYLDAADTERLIASCDRNGPQGLRDRAIILLLLRLGLRAGDIVAMRPSDIDWRDATLVVRGKGRRDSRLPLPQDAGDAVLDYIEHARPPVAIDRIFLCTNAPYRPLRAGMAVSGIVRAALRRAGIKNPPSHGAHLLRHTLATSMLRAGAGLYEIGCILRHQTQDTTAHYAKVDFASLRQIAQPWPEGGASC